jgi:hypothetical protein
LLLPNAGGENQFIQSAIVGYYAILLLIGIRLFDREKTYNQLIE